MYSKMQSRREATIDDLYRVGKRRAELVNGEIVLMSPTGGLPGFASGAIFASLWEYCRRTKRGVPLTDNVAYVVNLPNRRSFSPDAGVYVGPPLTAKFVDGAPIFAAEVRSEGGYGPAAERKIAAKRADYFAAGTLVVWDVDVLREARVRVYRRADPDRAAIFGRGEIAEAEPALPGWAMAVDDLFPTN